MRKQVLTTIAEHEMLTPGMGIVIGLSGGADSVALTHFLHNLTELRLRIICVHVHHGLRGHEADEDADFCAHFCKQLGIDLVVFEKDAAAEAVKMGVGVEEAGRVLRYGCFNEVLRQRDYDKIAVAHTASDVAETVLMQVVRGAGGIRGIPPVNGNIIRPFIDIGRNEVLAYCERQGLAFCEDSTNHQSDYSRNWVRNVLLPQIAGHLNPSAADALCRLAKISADEDAFLDNIAKNAYEKCVDSHEIDIGVFCQYDIAIQRRIVRIALHKAFGSKKDVTYSHVESIREMAQISTQSGKQVALPRDFMAEKVYNKVCIRKSAEFDTFSVTLPKGQEVFVPQIDSWVCLGNPIMHEKAFTKALDCDRITDVQIRTRQNGDRIFFKNVGTKKIKDFFMDKKLPRAIREKTVFIACGQDIIVMEDLQNPSRWIESHKFEPEVGANVVYLQIWR
ncbi:MAG: tRNA lysidine(34) synthetase TilS [Defluviitaleaceae bacterium]|nr:tRNA lysidine(34) synthetase TilS [Defluviitaleaceae bacterium]